MVNANIVKTEVITSFIFQRQVAKLWQDGRDDEGVLVKISRNVYTCCPERLYHVRGGLLDAVRLLNVRAAMTINTRVIRCFLQLQHEMSVPIQEGMNVQVLPSVSHLPACQKHQFAAFIDDASYLVIWADDPNELIARGTLIQEKLMAMIWAHEAGANEKTNPEQSPSSIVLEPPASDAHNQESLMDESRPLNLQAAILCAATLALTVGSIGSGWRLVAIELAIDGGYTRLAFLVVVSLQMWLALFFMQSVIGCVAQMMGPTHQVKRNCKFFSGIRPARIQCQVLPHVTIQCPVYKEGLYSVIEPTIKSLKAAISTYEMQGGRANIFVNDDGMQVISDEARQTRQEFYEEHNIGWVARPKHNPRPADTEKKFIRAGKFKKASNMNYALFVSARVEEKLSHIERHPGWTIENETAAYNNCLARVIEADEGRTWANGNVRLGDYILLIDSDTRVPSDCLLDAVSEMEQSPQVAIIQFASGVMNVTESFFENGITFFTNLIYTAITFAVACGDVAPFVGHNAILRWSAIQEIAYNGPDGSDKYWSETTVSEDFDMALRLQTAGYILRFASYFGLGFKEGVSLTVYDELARWEKYSYGCSELIFQPLKQWPRHGPLTPLFLNFLTSGMPLPSKFTIMAYIGTYYAIASAWILTVMNYFILGWYNGHLDHYYVDSFKIFFALIVVFTALGNVALAVLRYRLGQATLLAALAENFKWVLLLGIFLGGLSLHVSQAIVSHLLGIDMSWGSTAKEMENTTFFAEIPKLGRRFRGTFAFCGAMTACMVFLANWAPWSWEIDTFVAVFPLANVVFSHALLPIVLNPNLMLFTW